jgi:hypothetical protein
MVLPMTKLHSYPTLFIRVPPPAAPPRSELITVQPSASVSASSNGNYFRLFYFRIYLINLSFVDMFILANIKKGIV